MTLSTFQIDSCSLPIRRSVECVNGLIEMSIRLSKATHTLKVLLHCADAGKIFPILSRSPLGIVYNAGATRTESVLGSCPLWVISGHVQRKQACPLYPRKRHQMRHMEWPLSAKSGHRRRGRTTSAST